MKRATEPTTSGRFARGSAARHPIRRPAIAFSEELLAASRCEPAAALRSLDCTDAGLDGTEAAARLRRFGPNQIARERRTGVIYELINRTKNPLNALLLTLATISYFLGDVRAALIIAVMVILSIVTVFIQEHRSNEAATKLRGRSAHA
jgi:Mg2+-importing ATPase